MVNIVLKLVFRFTLIKNICVHVMRVGTRVPDPLILIRIQIRGSVSQNYKSGPRRLINYGSNVSGTVVGTYIIILYIHSIRFTANQVMGKTMSGSRKFTEIFFYSHLKTRK
jgi:hypothetical protein